MKIAQACVVCQAQCTSCMCVKLTKMDVFALKSRFDLILITKYHDSTKLFIYYDIVHCLSPTADHTLILSTSVLYVQLKQLHSFRSCPITDPEFRLFRFLIGR